MNDTPFPQKCHRLFHWPASLASGEAALGAG